MADIGSPPPIKWTDTSLDRKSPTTWFDAIPGRSKAPGMSVFSYVNRVNVRTDLWQGLLDHGATLLEHVLGFLHTSQVFQLQHGLSKIL